jgi:hypothetical protein
MRVVQFAHLAVSTEMVAKTFHQVGGRQEGHML